MQADKVPNAQHRILTYSHKRPSMKVNLKITLRLHLIESDLFDNIPLQKFDYILINPPYFPKRSKGFLGSGILL